MANTNHCFDVIRTGKSETDQLFIDGCILFINMFYRDKRTSKIHTFVVSKCLLMLFPKFVALPTNTKPQKKHFIGSSNLGQLNLQLHPSQHQKFG